jgi:hypothetical protein
MSSLRVTRDTNGAGIKKLLKNMKDSDKVVQVGFPSGIPHGSDGSSVAFIASVHEYGAPSQGIPERPFLAVTIKNHKKDYSRLNKVSAVKLVNNQTNFDSALGLLGTMAQGHVQEYVANGDFAPLQPETILRKKSSKPLIDTGQMRQSVTWEIQK